MTKFTGPLNGFLRALTSRLSQSARPDIAPYLSRGLYSKAYEVNITDDEKQEDTLKDPTHVAIARLTKGPETATGAGTVVVPGINIGLFSKEHYGFIFEVAFGRATGSPINMLSNNERGNGASESVYSASDIEAMKGGDIPVLAYLYEIYQKFKSNPNVRIEQNEFPVISMNPSATIVPKGHGDKSILFQKKAEERFGPLPSFFNDQYGLVSTIDGKPYSHNNPRIVSSLNISLIEEKMSQAATQYYLTIEEKEQEHKNLLAQKQKAKEDEQRRKDGIENERLGKSVLGPHSTRLLEQPEEEHWAGNNY